MKLIKHLGQIIVKSTTLLLIGKSNSTLNVINAATNLRRDICTQKKRNIVFVAIYSL